MAYADYHHCAVCKGKAFYDANITDRHYTATWDPSEKELEAAVDIDPDPPPEWIEAMAIAQATGGKTEWGQHDRVHIKEGYREDSRNAYRALRDKIMEKNDAS